MDYFHILSTVFCSIIANKEEKERERESELGLEIEIESVKSFC
jgi:hypothetical protein